MNYKPPAFFRGDGFLLTFASIRVYSRLKIPSLIALALRGRAAFPGRLLPGRIRGLPPVSLETSRQRRNSFPSSFFSPVGSGMKPMMPALRKTASSFSGSSFLRSLRFSSLAGGALVRRASMPVRDSMERVSSRAG